MICAFDTGLPVNIFAFDYAYERDIREKYGRDAIVQYSDAFDVKLTIGSIHRDVVSATQEGVRLQMCHPRSEIPAHHSMAMRFINRVMTASVAATVHGLVVLHAEISIVGTIVTIHSKLWFLDRMVWFYQDMSADDVYRSWLY